MGQVNFSLFFLLAILNCLAALCLQLLILLATILFINVDVLFFAMIHCEY